MLIANGVEFRYSGTNGCFCIECPVFNAGTGRVTCLIGKNGSGKTTLLRILAGRLIPQSGTVTYGNTSLVTTKQKGIMPNISWMDASAINMLVEELLVVDHLALAMQAANLEVPFFHRRLSNGRWDQLQHLGGTLVSTINEIAERKVWGLSSGERQTLAISLSFMKQQEIFLADESTSHLDIVNSRTFFRELTRLTTDKGVVTVLVTHNILLAAEYANSIYILDGGTVSEVPLGIDMEFAERIDAVEAHFRTDTISKV